VCVCVCVRARVRACVSVSISKTDKLENIVRNLLTQDSLKLVNCMTVESFCLSHCQDR